MQIIGQQTVYLEVVDSTNNYAANLIKTSKPPDGTAIMAHSQESGRGQRGTAWNSAPGQNLTFSVILYPRKVEVQNQSLINKCFAVALADAVSELCGKNALVKWPNDIYVNNRKICGVLIENSIEGRFIASTVLGIGLNLNQAVFPGLPMATSVFAESGFSSDREPSLHKVFHHLDKWYFLLNAGRFALIDESYHQMLFRLNEWHRFVYRDGEMMGKVRGVNNDGNLLLEKGSGEIITCYGKELLWL